MPRPQGDVEPMGMSGGWCYLAVSACSSPGRIYEGNSYLYSSVKIFLSLNNNIGGVQPTALLNMMFATRFQAYRSLSPTL